MALNSVRVATLIRKWRSKNLKSGRAGSTDFRWFLMDLNRFRDPIWKVFWMPWTKKCVVMLISRLIFHIIIGFEFECLGLENQAFGMRSIATINFRRSWISHSSRVHFSWFFGWPCCLGDWVEIWWLFRATLEHHQILAIRLVGCKMGGPRTPWNRPQRAWDREGPWHWGEKRLGGRGGRRVGSWGEAATRGLQKQNVRWPEVILIISTSN